MIIAAIAGSASVQKVFDRTWLIWLGRQSYSLYLIHVPVIMAVDLVFGGAMPLWALFTMPVLLIGLAEMFHRWAELPSVAFATWLTGSRQTGGMVAGSIALVSAGGKKEGLLF